MTTFRIYEPASRILSSVSIRDFQICIDDAAKADVEVVLIDLQNVMFMDSQGLGALMSARHRAETAGVEMALCSLSGQARMLLEMSGIDQIFKIYSDRNAFKDTVLVA